MFFPLTRFFITTFVTNYLHPYPKVEGNTNAKFEKLGKGVEQTKKVAAAAGREASAAKKAAELADRNSQMGVAEVGRCPAGFR